jgi:hypothetical protein
MKMNFKLKTLVAVLALSAAAATATSANAAATTATGANGSSLIFSAWDDTANAGQGASYSFDLGLYLDNLVGADTATSNPASFTTASGSTYTGAGTGDGFTIATIALPDFNLTSGVWNLAAADGTGRKRMLTSNRDTAYAGTTNSQVNSTTGAVTNYIGLGAALSTVTGTTATSADAWYANSSAWGDDLATTGYFDSSNALGSQSNLFVTWAKSSTTSAQAGLSNLTYNGNNVFATTYSLAGVTYLNISSVAAVPETDTSGMMLAGLGLMGFIARRRNSKQA